jgi:amidohydrolase
MPPSHPAAVEAVTSIVDQHRAEVLDLVAAIGADGETGFFEHRTSRRVADFMTSHGFAPRTGVARTGIVAEIDSGRPGPTVAVIGELDGLPRTGGDDGHDVMHACGHHLQIGTMLLAGLALQELAGSGSGRVRLMAVPSEEIVELDRRMELIAAGEIEFVTGKAEFIRLGEFDDVDAAMMVHSTPDVVEFPLAAGAGGNGLVVKRATFTGVSAHGSMPDRGINALTAARVALASIDAIRDTFDPAASVRVQAIITRGGTAASIVPDDVAVEIYLRAATVEALTDAGARLDRALRAGGLVTGATVGIQTIPGFLPVKEDAGLVALFRARADDVLGPGVVKVPLERTASTDMGDLSHVVPVVHAFAGGASGSLHHHGYHVDDLDMAVVDPARVVALTVLDVLAGELTSPRPPLMSRDEYLAYLRDGYAHEVHAPS